MFILAKRVWWLGIVAVALVLALPASKPASTQPRQPLIIFSAASLSDAFEEIGAAFTLANPEVVISFNFGGSSTLAAQIEQGAAADLFASANLIQMNRLAEKNLLAGPAQIFARNRLVVILPVANKADITELSQLARPGIQIILAAPNVPIRQYSEEALAKLAALPAYGADFADQVLANLVSEEDNVRQVVAKIALGEADAGLVYQSDVTPDVAEKLLVLPIADTANVIAEYPIAVLKESTQQRLAEAFIAYLQSEAGQSIMAKWKFLPYQPELAPTTEATNAATATATPKK
jgi:molybdate transport system substrate-binding protein